MGQVRPPSLSENGCAMRKILSLVCAAGIALVVACGERPATSPDSPVLDGPRANAALPKCEQLTSTQVQELINNVYRYVGLDPAIGTKRWSNIGTGTVSEAWNMAKEILDAKQRLGLAATTEMIRLINYAFCTVNVAVGFPGGDGWVVSPSSKTTINLVTTDKQAAFVLPPGSLEQISLLAITSTADTLRTNLDKYPITRNFSKYPSNKFAKPAQVYLCGSVLLSNNNWESVVNRLRLGHNIGATGFEILPYATQGIALLTCNENILTEAPPSVFERSLNLMLPKFLWAQKGSTRGCAGVGGTVSELSPIGPVDPQIITAATSSTSQSAPAGSFVSSPPAIALFTANGTPLGSIPVAFGVTTGGGTITPTTPVPSDTKGNASSTSWRLGTTAGTNTARATPASGGAAVPGTYFQPLFVDFTATGTTAAGTPTGIRITGGPIANAVYVAGTSLPILTATVVDATGATVTTFTGTITVASTVANSLRGTLSLNAIGGVATFSALQAALTGSQQIRATVTGTTLAGVSSSFIVSAASPSALALVSGNSTTAALGTSPTALPTVRVTDVYGNLVPNVPVYFGPSNNAASVASPVSTSMSGTASVSWPLQHGINNLMASLDATVSPTASARRFEFTSTATSSLATLASCTSLGTVKTAIGSYNVAWVPTSTQLSQSISNVKFYLSTGIATTSTPVPYRLTVQALVTTKTGTAFTAASSISTAVLYGLSSENKQVNFNFPNGVPLANASRVVFKIIDNASTTSVVKFNAGGGKACAGTTVITSGGANYRTGSAMIVIAK